MTTLAKRKSRLVLVTSDLVRERGKSREVVLEPQSHYTAVRLKGTRTRFEVSYAAIYHFAARIAAEKAHAAKKAARGPSRAYLNEHTW
jgi:hypothetical protein